MTDQDPRSINSVAPVNTSQKQLTPARHDNFSQGQPSKEEYHHDDRQATRHMSTKSIVTIVIVIVILGLLGVLIWQCNKSSQDNKNSSKESSTSCKGSCECESDNCG